MKKVEIPFANLTFREIRACWKVLKEHFKRVTFVIKLKATQCYEGFFKLSEQLDDFDVSTLLQKTLCRVS